MVASIIKLLPLLQFLLEVFKADDGKLTAKAKAALLAFLAVASFAAYVSYAYIQQFHALVELKAHQQYLVKSEGEAVGRSLRAENRINELENKLDQCRARPPYEGASASPNPKPIADRPPVILKTPEPDKPKPLPKRNVDMPVATVPSRESTEKSLADRMEKISRQINN